MGAEPPLSLCVCVCVCVHRHRNKSYSSVDLLWDKVNTAGGLRAGIIKNALGHNAHHAHHAPAGSAPSLAGAAAGGGALLDSRTGSMSTVVSISAGGIPTNASGNLDEVSVVFVFACVSLSLSVCVCVCVCWARTRASRVSFSITPAAGIIAKMMCEADV